MNKKLISVFAVLVLISFISASNISIMYGQNDSGGYVPFQLDNSGRLKTNLNLVNITSNAISISENLTLGAGIIQWNSSSNTYVYYNGSQFKELGTITNAGTAPTGAVMSFNLASCPTGWVLADGSGGTPDLRGIFVRGAGTSGIMQMANGTNFSATYGEYMNDSFQGHWHNGVGEDTPVLASGSSYGRTGYRTKVSSQSETSNVWGAGNSTSAGSSTGTPRIGAETRPASYALIYCQKGATEDTSSSVFKLVGNVISLFNTTNDLFIDNDVNITGQLNLGNGSIWYNDSDEKYYYYNNSKWQGLGTGSGESLWNNESGFATYNGSVIVRGNLNVTGNISGGSPVKIVGGLQVYNESGTIQLSVNKSTGNVFVGGDLNLSGDFFGNYTAENRQYVYNGSDWVGARATAEGIQHIFLNDSSRKYDAVPENAVMSFNQASCPAGWSLADGTSGTPDLRGIFVRGAGTSGIMQMANGTNFSATYGEYSNDSFQEHYHNLASDNSGFITEGGGSGSALTLNTYGPYTSGDHIEARTLISAGSAYGSPRTGAETRPASYALIYCVKTAEDSESSNSIWNVLANGIVSLVNSSQTLEVGNLNVTGNISGGSPVKIVGGLEVLSGNLAVGDIERSQCPENWILVPGDSNFTNNDFCVMKYEAKEDSNKKVVSSASGTPFASLSQYEAKNSCERVGAHLCTAGEAVTIARNIEATTINDMDDDAGLQLATGHSDNVPASALAVSTGADPIVSGCSLTATMENSANDFVLGSCEIRGSGTDANGYNGTGQVWSATGYSSGLANKAQLRTFVLSNGNVIWDFSGNVWEWTDNLCGVPWNTNVGYLEWNNAGLTDWEKYIVGPLTSSTSVNGVGQFYGCTANGNAFLRGDNWAGGANAGAFALHLSNAPSDSSTTIGFRCCK